MWIKSASFSYGTGERMYTLIGYHVPEYISDETKKLEVWYEGEKLTHFISWHSDLIQSAQKFCNEDAFKRNLKASRQLIAEEKKRMKLKELNDLSNPPKVIIAKISSDCGEVKRIYGTNDTFYREASLAECVGHRLTVLATHLAEFGYQLTIVVDGLNDAYFYLKELK